MAQENQKPSLQYLRSRYNKFYKQGNIDKAKYELTVLREEDEEIYLGIGGTRWI